MGYLGEGDLGLGNVLNKLQRRIESPTQLHEAHSHLLRVGSSITSRTPELMKQIEQVSSGRPLDVYELYQNMHDYGTKDPRHLPETVYKTKSGEIIHGSCTLPARDIQEIELITHGEGMVPQDVTFFVHGGGEDTLGVNGRGASLTYAALTMRGMGVEIESNHQGQTFRGKVKMVPVPHKEYTNMVFDYEPDPDARGKRTVIRITNPDDTLMRGLRKVSEIFLPSNPHYARATLVRPESGAVAPISEKVVWTEGSKRARVECLMGMPENGIRNNGAPSSYIYVGGLQVNTSRNYALPWAIWGAEHMKDDNRVGRSTDSSSAVGYYERAISQALCHTKSPALIRAWLDLNDGQPQSRFITPYELKVDSDLSPDTRGLMIQELKARYDGRLPFVCESEGVMEYATKQKVEPLIRGATSEFCKQLMTLGCENASRKIVHEVVEVKTDGTLQMRIADIGTATKVLAEVGIKDGLHIQRQDDGSTHVEFGDQKLMSEFGADAFQSLPRRETPREKILSAATFFLNDEGCADLQLVVEGPKETVTHTFKADKVARHGKHYGELGIKVTSSTRLTGNTNQKVYLRINPRKGEMLSKYLQNSFESDMKSALSSVAENKPINAMTEDERIAELERYRAKIAAEMKAEEDIASTKKALGRVLSGKITLAELLAQMRGESLTEDRREAVVREGLHLGVERHDEWTRIPRYRIKTNGFGINFAGYFREDVGDTLQIVDGKPVWVSSHKDLQSLEGRADLPEDWQFATEVYLNPSEWTPIPIRIDTKKVEFKAKPGLEVRVDKKNGIVVARGDEYITLYQNVKSSSLGSFYKPARPDRIDTQTHCAISDLDVSLAKELDKIRQSKQTPREKAARILNLQEQRFHYDNNHVIETEVMWGVNGNIALFERNLLNKASGTCNYAATSVALMLRLCGIPSRMEGGSVAGSKVSYLSDTHAWPIFWDGTEWRGIEATRGSVSPSVRLDLEASTPSRRARLLEPKDLIIFRESPTMWAGYQKTEITRDMRMMLMLIAQSPLLVKEFIAMVKRTDTRQEFEDLLRIIVMSSAEAIEGGARAVAHEQRNILLKSKVGEKK